MYCTEHANIEAILQCGNPECARRYCIDCLHAVADLWGVILEDLGPNFNFGITCPSCKMTSITAYDRSELSSLYDNLKRYQEADSDEIVDQIPGLRIKNGIVSFVEAETRKGIKTGQLLIRNGLLVPDSEKMDRVVTERDALVKRMVDADVESENLHRIKECKRRKQKGSYAARIQKIFPNFLLSGEDFMTSYSLEERKKQNLNFLDILEFDIVRHFEDQGEIPFYLDKEEKKRIALDSLKVRYMLDNAYFNNFVYAKRIDFMLEFFKHYWEIDFELNAFPELQEKYKKSVFDAMSLPSVSLPPDLPNEMVEAVRKFEKSNSALAKILGQSKAIINLKYRIACIAAKEVNVLITGETGTGKELVADAIHVGSGRSGYFRAVNCAAISRELFESELFGHVRGSFSGAVRDRKGEFELARDGTLFLDEIGKMPLEHQSKLLRAIETKRIKPIGSEKEKEVGVRIIAASNKDLKEEVNEGRFLPDLFYRLQGRSLNIPPLRDRKDDIPLLVNHFLSEFCHKYNLIPPKISEDYLGALTDYPFYGNVRELMTLVDTSLEYCDGVALTPDHLPDEVRDMIALPVGSDDSGRYKVTDEDIIAAMKKTQGNKSEAARLLGVKYITILRRWKKIEPNLQ